MTDIAKFPTAKTATFGITPANLQEAMDLAKLMAGSDLVPKDYKGSPGNCLIAMQMGAEIGLPPMQSLQNIAVINGRPSVWGDALPAIVKGRRDFVDLIESYDEQAQTFTCIARRKGCSDVVQTFSKRDAENAGLWGKQGPWKQYPRRMLQMRARSFAIRDQWPDALKGLSVAEDVMDIRDMGDVEVVETTSTADRLRAKLAQETIVADSDGVIIDDHQEPPNVEILEEIKSAFESSETKESFSVVKQAALDYLNNGDIDKAQYDELIVFGLGEWSRKHDAAKGIVD